MTKSTDKDFKVWEGMYHEIMNEEKGDEVVSYLVHWIDAHC